MPLLRETVFKRSMNFFDYDSWKGLFVEPTTTARPGLDKFEFNFTYGDHHIRTIIAGCFEGSGLPLPNLLELKFSDYESDDANDHEYTYDTASRSLPPLTTYHRVGGEGRGSGSCNTSVTLGDPVSGIPVLVGFSLTYGKTDHHVWEVMVSLGKDADGRVTLETTLEDKPSCPAYSYAVEYAVVPESRVAYTARASATDHRGPAILPGGNDDVLQGFWLKFRDDDHHLRELSVSVGGNLGTTEVVFQDDSNPSPPYDVWVDYAELKRFP